MEAQHAELYHQTEAFEIGERGTHLVPTGRLGRDVQRRDPEEICDSAGSDLVLMVGLCGCTAIEDGPYQDLHKALKPSAQSTGYLVGCGDDGGGCG